MKMTDKTRQSKESKQDLLKKRAEYDDRALENSMRQIADVLGRESEKHGEAYSEIAQLEKIFKYFGMAMPEECENTEEICERSGIFTRKVELEAGWRKGGVFPMLTMHEGRPTAVIPGRFGGYRYYDPSRKKFVTITAKNEGDFEKQALLLHRPLPDKRLGIKDIIKFIFRSCSGGDMFALIFFTVVFIGIGVMIPNFINALFGFVLPFQLVDDFAPIASIMLCMGLSSAIFGAVRSTIFERASARIKTCASFAITQRTVKLPAAFFCKYSAGDLSMRIQDFEEMCGNIFSLFVAVIHRVVALIVYMTSAVYFAPQLSGALFTVIAVYCVVSFSAVILFTKINIKGMGEKGKTKGILTAFLRGIEKVKSAGLYKRAFTRWAKSYQKEAQTRFAPPLFVKIFPVIPFIMYTVSIVVFYCIAADQQISSVSLLAFVALFSMIIDSVLFVVWYIPELSQIKPAYDRLRPIMNENASDGLSKQKISNFRGELELSNVCFQYGQGLPMVLEHMNLQVKSGEFIAIVGHSGCGKTTLLKLLLGFLHPSSGDLLLDDINITQLDMSSILRQSGIVLQNSRLHEGTVFSNLAGENAQLTKEQAYAALDFAQIGDEIRNRKEGLATHVEQNGENFSGGQRQRLLIARAVAQQPRLIILDEATSALDTISEMKIMRAVAKMDVTRIVFAHRLATLKYCNKILMMEAGKIVEEGTYYELIEKKEKFYNLVKKQMMDT